MIGARYFSIGVRTSQFDADYHYDSEKTAVVIYAMQNDFWLRLKFNKKEFKRSTAVETAVKLLELMSVISCYRLEA